jgi:hypothetical protein
MTLARTQIAGIVTRTGTENDSERTGAVASPAELVVHPAVCRCPATVLAARPCATRKVADPATRMVGGRGVDEYPDSV